MSTALHDDTFETDVQSDQPACVLVFNANDPSGAGGLASDINAIASVGAHALPVVTGAYTRDTAEIIDHHAMDDEAVAEQARTILEDVTAQVIKIGFCGSAENLSAIAEICADYADVPVIAYMPDLSWWDEVQIDLYLDAFRELVLPQTTVLVGNHSTLWRWLVAGLEFRQEPGAARHCTCRQRDGRSLHTGDRHPRARPADRERAGVPASRVVQRALRAFRSHVRRCWRHLVGGAGGTAGQWQRPGRIGQGSTRIPRPLPGRGLSARHGPYRARPPVLGPTRGGHRGRPRNEAQAAATFFDLPAHDTKH